jgi:hypothetical protein
MNKKLLAALVAMGLVASLMTMTGCTRVRLQDRPETRTTTDTTRFDLQGATSVTTDIRFGVGRLSISAADATGTALVGDFTYAPVEWKPEASYSVDGSTGVVTVSQPHQVKVVPFGRVENTWNLRLGTGVPTTLKLQLGVGQSDVDLRGVDLTQIDAQTGVGDSMIDLSGTRTSSVSGRIQAGVGNLTLRLPRSIGVRVTGRHDGVGDYSADGFITDGNAVENEAYRSGTGPKIDIELVRGVGDVTLVLVD